MYKSLIRRLVGTLLVASLPVMLMFAISGGVRPALAADEIVIKLGTLAPENSAWYNTLRSIGEQWQVASGGAIKLRIYPGGTQGNEGSIIRKIRINQLQAATITATGLIDIERSSLSLGMPMLIESYEELDYIRDRMIPLFEQRIEKAGFKVLNWGDAGWVYFFTRQPINTPEKLKPIKMWSWEGDPPATKAFIDAGLHPVAIAATDVLPALQTGMIEGFPQTALASLALQWFGGAKNMINARWAPMIGATVISLKGWEKVPAQIQPKLLEIARLEGEKLKNEVRRLDQDAINEMKKYGLNVVEPANMDEWRKFAQSFYPHMRGTMMVADTMDQVIKLHNEYNATNKK